MNWPEKLTKRDAMRAASAGRQALAAGAAAQTLFEVGGRRVLPLALQRVVKASAEGEASRLLGGGLLAAGRNAVGLLEGGVGRALATQTVGAAARQIAKSLGTAAGAGAAIDGGWALAQAVRSVGDGTMTTRDAAVHVAREAGTGAAATAAGTGAAVLLVALTGGAAAPALFLVAAAASLGVKLGLDAWLVPGKREGNASAALAVSTPTAVDEAKPA